MFGFGKGKIKINLGNYNFKVGDTIEGTLDLAVKKPLEATELSIQLVGKQKITSGYGGNQRTQYRTIFDFKQPISGEKTYSSVDNKAYPFKVLIPADAGAKTAPQGTMGTMINAAAALTGRRSMIKWYLIGRLSVKGFDISKKVQINIA